MTACLYISPFQTPALMSDIIVSNEAMPPTSRPGHISFRCNENRKFHFHARKNYILSKNTCVVAAGNVQKIHHFLKCLEQRLEDFENDERPSYNISTLANSFEEINILSSYASTNKNGRYFENNCFVLPPHSPPDNKLLSNVFGSCHAIGSGAKRLIANLKDATAGATDLIERAKHIDSTEFSQGIIDKPTMDFVKEKLVAREIIRGTFNAMCSRSIISDFNRYTDGSDYGGFFEYSFFDIESQSWARQLTQLFLFFEIDRSKRPHTASIMDFAVTFDPNDFFGKIVVYTKNNGITFHILDNLLRPLNRKDFDISLDNFFPQSASVTFIERRSAGDYLHIGSRVTDIRDSEAIIFDPKGGHIGMSQEWLDRVLDELSGEL